MKSICAKVLFFVALAIWQCAQAASAGDFLVSEVVDGVYLHEGVHEEMSVKNLGAIGNSGFIVGKQSVAVIDPGGSLEAGQLLRKAIADVTDLPIKYVILTHFHLDHVLGAAAFKDVENIVAHEHYTRAVSMRAQFYLDRFKHLIPGSIEEAFVLPDTTVAVDQSLPIDLGERIILVEAHRLAHTDNDLTVHDRLTNTLWASDLVFAQRTPSLDGSLTGWLDVLLKLASDEYELAIPGHGRPSMPSELLGPHIRYLQQLETDVRAMIEQGMALSTVLENHEASAGTGSLWSLFAAQHASNLAKAYAELEWE